jgi:hypothetical protein
MISSCRSTWMDVRALTLCLLAATCAGLMTARADDPGIAHRSYTTRAIEGESPVLDGRLNDPVWDLVEWAGDFTQRSPYSGETPAQPTEFKILYDAQALYVAFRAWDAEPGRIENQLARRDWFPGDWVEINIDSRGDQRTAFSFTTSVSGTRGDEYVSENGDCWDSSWDPVWSASTAIDDQGWTAEIRIPLSQLRYCSKDEHVWGIQITRRIFRHEERSIWQYIPEDAPGWVSEFGELRGIRGIKAQKQIELLPYAVGYYERFEAIAGDPFATGEDQDFDAGLDGKIGLSGNTILDLTINPDFGQVEADPAVVNLTAFETFFSERRPFFIEGSELLSYPLANAITGGSFASDILFYSRRIGRQPQGSPALAAGEYAKIPSSTSILGAAKLSGRTAGGLSVGLLDAVTGEERARIRDAECGRTEVVEPLTNFCVGRVQKDYDEGCTILGGMATAVNRNIERSAVEFLPSAAYAGGVDFERWWSDRSYVLTVHVLGSHLRGSENALLRAQAAPARYFQRPDAGHVSVDSTRTSLSGYAGSAYVGKGGGRWRFQGGVAWRSPGFEINDLGYMRRADEINHSAWGSYNITDPFWIFHRLSLNANEWFYWDFGGDLLCRQANINSNGTFKNEWSYHAGVTRSLEQRVNHLLRGGPSFDYPGSWDGELSINGDGRKPINPSLGASWSAEDESDSYASYAWVGLRCRPTNALSVSVSPEYDRYRSELQYVSRESFAGEDRHILADIVQRTFTLTLRFDYCVTPSLTVQYYAQPFVASGEYTRFKRITDPHAERYTDRFHAFTPGADPGSEIRYDAEAGAYEIDENRDGETDYAIQNPDFSYKSFHSNFVVRWEYKPGSTAYFVWSQGREGATASPAFDVADGMDGLFRIHPDNVFLIKVNHWLSW